MDRLAEETSGVVAPTFLARLGRRLLDPTILSVPIVVLVFSLFRSKHLIADLPVWVIALLVGGCYLLTVLEASLRPQSVITGWRLKFRVGTVLGAITIVIYAVGWGPTLALGLLFGAADCMRNLGTRVTRPAMVFSVLFIGLGQLAIATGIAPSLVSQPFVHGLAALAALGIVFTIKLLEWVFASRERTERRFMALVQYAADMIVVADARGRLTYVSPSFEEQLGHVPSQAISVMGGDLIHPDDLDRVVDAFMAAQASDGRPLSLELRVRTADGTWRSFDATITNLLADPDVAGIVANLHDITDRKASEVALRDAEERFRTSFDEAPIGMILVSRRGQVIQANRAFCRIVGRSQDEVTGSSVQQLTHPDDRESSLSWTTRLLAGEVSNYQIEKRYLHADGHAVWTSLHASFVRDQDGKALYAIGQIEDITERRAMSALMAHAAIHDPLTDLPNRVLFADRLDLALARSLRGPRHVAVVFLDLDHFKVINDSMGHDGGDQLLRAVAERIRTSVRPGDTVARFGGDEFTILLEDITDAAHARDAAERTLTDLARPFELDDGEVFVSASAGIALSASGHDTSAVLLRNADAAMYRAKERGRGGIELYDLEDDPWTVRRLRTGNDLHRALERNEFELHYQPFVDLHTTTMVGVEALVRWRHPTRGLLGPGEFIDLAEDTGLIVPLGYWVIGEACRQAAAWQELRNLAGQEAWRLMMSINVSPRQLVERNFASRLVEIVDASGTDRDTILLEVTETTVMRDPEHAIAVLESLRAQGMHICIDDFGTGYSSLSYLKRLPVETIKIDRSFVDGLGENPEDTAIVRAVIGMADSLRLLCVAEGVETTEQVDALRALGCHIAQGFLFGHPLGVERLAPFPRDDLSSWADTQVITVS
ncbi:MAG TPA: EAL domain-containing protein [Acidimicrobiales bacterium]|nr:EAL domain-containing protein [Acidimicrobiales bacterium]